MSTVSTTVARKHREFWRQQGKCPDCREHRPLAPNRLRCAECLMRRSMSANGWRKAMQEKELFRSRYKLRDCAINSRYEAIMMEISKNVQLGKIAKKYRTTVRTIQVYRKVLFGEV